MRYDRIFSIEKNQQLINIFTQNFLTMQNNEYRTLATITCSWSVTALVYKPRILGLKNEEFPFLVHKLSVI